MIVYSFPQMHLLYAQWCGSEWIQKAFKIFSTSTSTKDVLYISEQFTILVFDGSSNIRFVAAETPDGLPD